MDCLQQIYCLIKDHDLPNWIILVFTILFWPTFLYFWSKRKLSYVKNLKISLSKDAILINGNKYDALRFTVTNSTTSTVFLTNMRLKNKPGKFTIHKDSTRDFYSGYYELKFYNPETNFFSIRDLIFYTDKEHYTAIAIDGKVDDSIFTFEPKWTDKLLRLAKYFVLEYTVLVGEKKFLVKTRY